MSQITLPSDRVSAAIAEAFAAAEKYQEAEEADMLSQISPYKRVWFRRVKRTNFEMRLAARREFSWRWCSAIDSTMVGVLSDLKKLCAVADTVSVSGEEFEYLSKFYRS